ncbi:hypothetical protein [Legionella impletisoli]|uniref:Peptidase A2 domain-containing protein n=1 Tax=Legionella impletisoli TaxID=343510 RepID=A0A917JNA2_9GAMM|nr:hypothetical protein [Legionella impletisoli]GGI78597.1 hypothetical protein GCM10007966_04080 [Legionella impletisoli]
MIRKIGLTTLLMTSLFSSNPALSAHENYLTPGVSISYELKPNSPELVTNVSWWPISAECTLGTEEGSTKISVLNSKKSVSINGSKLTPNQKIVLDVKDKQVLAILADSGAQVELINLGEKVIRATCMPLGPNLG